MSSRHLLVLGLALLALLAFWMLAPGGSGPGGAPAFGPDGSGPASGAQQAGAVESPAERTAATAEALRERLVGEGEGSVATVRGVVLDARTLAPLPGVEVAAMERPPSVERLLSRFRGAFLSGAGFFTQTSAPADILAKTTTGPDGTFELSGLDSGLVFLDARSDFTFVRQPAQVRVAAGEVVAGIELLGSPGGRVQGRVVADGGVPQPGVVVSLRPGLNAFLGQMTQRRYRWLEAVTDEAGRYDLPGVPEGSGYVVSAAGPSIALEEVHGITVREGQVTVVDVEGHPGARIAGRVVGPDGAPVAGANVAMVYLDMSRVLFSADGREEPIATAADGTFAMQRVAAGRIGFIAAADGLAPSEIQELTVVDGGLYDGLEFALREGEELHGIVVDQDGAPVPAATVAVRPIERPRDPDVLKLVLKVREVEVRTGPDGRFRAAGLDGERSMVEVSKPGYVTEVRFGARRDEELRIELTRGVTVVGRVVDAAGQPVRRFRVATSSRRASAPETEAGARPEAGAADDERGWRSRRGRREGGFRLAAGQRLEDRELGDDWQEFYAVDGRFTVEGVPPGRVRVRVRAEGYRHPDHQEVELAAGQRSDALTFTLEEGAVARGVVVDEDTGAPVPDAQVTAYRDRGDDGRRGGLFRVRMDAEDFDLLGLTAGASRSARTDSRGRFEIDGLAGGRYRFTARHPDLAKASTEDVELDAHAPTEGIVIELGAGGGIEGRVTGAGMRPLGDALIVAASLQAGAFKSDSTDPEGFYRIEGLPPGQYIVFKSRMDEQSSNLGYDLMGNMRLKTVTVRRGGFAKLDIHDESEDSVRVVGTVRDGGQPVARAMVTAIGADSEGIFGMGVRAQPTDSEGRFELIGLQPGSYFFQVTRFRGRPEQASLAVEVPAGVREYRIALDLPQSYVAGRVVDASGAPVAGIRVSAGVQEGGIADAPGLLGIVMKNGVSEDRTDEDGAFRLERMAAGTYRLVASGSRGGRRARGGEEAARWGEVMQEGVVVDGLTPVEGLTLVVPRAGRVTGTVVDGNGNPVPGAEVHWVREGRSIPDPERQLTDLFGVQARPERTDAEGRFALDGMTPGTYRIRADADGLAPGVAEDVVVAEEATADVLIRVVRGATLRLRARNVDGERIPLANVTVLDGNGKPLASKVSVLSVFRRMVGREERIDDSGWHEIGNVPPDTYTVIVREEGQPELRFTREIRDGETVEWDIDVAAELEASGRGRK